MEDTSIFPIVVQGGASKPPFTFPVEFPTGWISAQCTHELGDSANTSRAASILSVSKTKISFHVLNGGSAYIFAIGY